MPRKMEIVILRGYLLDSASGHQMKLRRLGDDIEDPRRTELKLRALPRLYAGRQPVDGHFFYVERSTPDYELNGQMVPAAHMEGMCVDVWCTVKRYMYGKALPARSIGWKLVCHKVRADYEHDNPALLDISNELTKI